MKRPLHALVLSLLLAMKAGLLMSSPAPGSGSPDFNSPTFTYSVDTPYVVFSFTDNSNEDDHYALYRSKIFPCLIREAPLQL